MLAGDPEMYLPFAALGALGPLVAATLLSFHEHGMTGVRGLYSPLLRWRVHFGWYFAALALPCVLLTGLLWLLNLAGRSGPIVYAPAAQGVIFGLLMSFVEEVGWRGYALPRLATRWGPFSAAVLIGGLWCLWHVPMFLGLAVPLGVAPLMLLYFVGASLFLTWIHRGTQGSLLLVVFAHLAAHLNNSHRALPNDSVPLIAHAIIYGALGLFVMRRFAHANRHRPTSRLPSNLEAHGRRTEGTLRN